ncbi:S-layer homology domain-containing protein [Niallia oryzisoli]|uniref:S-layer homology domain-containing protein n=1 Tax=Niallia oryzisoli TaxID=1737571 RepID=A0ABZ2CAP5_9BACI
MRKWFLLSVVFIFSSSLFGLSAMAATFTDLPASHRFYEEITYLENKGIIGGYPDKTVRPEAEVTRAEAAIMIGRTLNLNGEQRNTMFTDVSAKQIASGYITSAVEAGVIKGFPDGTFRPNTIITREQAAILISRAFNLTKESEVPFTDISPSMESYPHIKRIVVENITNGYEDYTFRPYVKVTRAHFSAFLARALNDDYKVKLPLIFLKDTSKVYHYEDGGKVRYVYENEEYENWNLWKVYLESGTTYSIVERQDSAGYKFGYPDSEYSVQVAFPIEVGHTWDGYGEMPDYYKITAASLSVTTPAGTFENVVEVTTTEGYVSYYAPFTGLIKTTKDGVTVTELTKIE